MSLVATNLVYLVPERAIVDRVSLRLDARHVHAILGPNGAGKSTLLRLLAGELQPDEGEILLNGKPLAAWRPLELARQRAVLPQSHSLAFGFTAGQVVELGRLPCPRRPVDAEARLMRSALERAGVASLWGRKYTTLSGGERARVQLARAMAQVWEPLDASLSGAPRFLLLDEPTASLDLAHQHDCLRSARAMAAEGVGVLVILHDPNLAFRYADEVTLLRDGKVLANGPPATAMTADSLTRLYRVPVELVTREGAAPIALVRDAVRSAAAPGRSAT